MTQWQEELRGILRRSDASWPKALTESEQFALYFPMYETARMWERAGNVEGALALYKEILKRFSPTGMLYYERPAILLERLGRYPEAIAICERAIRSIEAKRWHGDVAAFQRRLKRLADKSKRMTK